MGVLCPECASSTCEEEFLWYDFGSHLQYTYIALVLGLEQYINISADCFVDFVFARETQRHHQNMSATLGSTELKKVNTTFHAHTA